MDKFTAFTLSTLVFAEDMIYSMKSVGFYSFPLPNPNKKYCPKAPKSEKE